MVVNDEGLNSVDIDTDTDTDAAAHQNILSARFATLFHIEEAVARSCVVEPFVVRQDRIV